MFINVGARTDITNYYSEWLMNRIREGYVLSRNPLFPNKVYRYRLDPEVVDCIIFCTKNPEPILDKIEEIRSRGFRVFFFVTITSYGRDIEPGVPDYHHVMASFKKLSGMVGKACVGWRYDPVFLTPKYTLDHHLTCFDEMARELSPYTDFCIFSFVELYKKLEFTFPELRAVSEQEKRILLAGLGEIAKKYGLRLQTCGDEADYTAYGICRSGCISARTMEKALGRTLKAVKPSPSRKGCGCLPSNDIGAYDTCPNGCRYCYATKDPALALKNFRNHDPHSPLLIGSLEPEDEIVEASQKSFLESYEQLTLDL